MTAFRVHPIAEKFPLMQGADFDELVHSIRQEGQHHPIVVHRGVLLDGRNRLRACELIGIEPRVVEWEGSNGASPAAWIIRTNLTRRDLTSPQRAMLAADPDILAVFEEEARKRQGTRTDLVAKLPQSSKAREAAAAAFQTSPRYVQDAKKVRQRSPKNAEKVIAGEMSLKQARQAVDAAELDEALSKIPADDRAPLADMVKSAPTTQSDKLIMAKRLAAMPQEDRTRIKVLAQSPDEYERRMAATQAADKPDPLPVYKLAMISLRVEIEKAIHAIRKDRPDHPALEPLTDLYRHLVTWSNE